MAQTITQKRIADLEKEVHELKKVITYYTHILISVGLLNKEGNPIIQGKSISEGKILQRTSIVPAGVDSQRRFG